MSGPLLAIDGPFVMYRSFFALPDSITDADGHPTNALLGAVNLILRIAADALPRAIVVCWGAEAAVYRKELYPDYHASRPPVPDALQWQFDRGGSRSAPISSRPTICSGPWRSPRRPPVDGR
jgi:DNA polymerase-1